MLPLSIGDCSRNSTQALRSRAADAQAELDAQRSGGCRTLVSIDVEARPTGQVWGHNPARPGPLDGQPECRYYTVALYSDGTRREWGPMAGS